MQTNLLTTYLVDSLEPFAKWISIGIFGLFALTLLVVAIYNQICKSKGKPYDQESFIKLFKTFVVILVIYSLIVGITMLALEIMKKYDTAYLEEKWVNLEVIKLVFIPLLITLVLALAYAITLFVLSKKQSKHTKLVSIVFGLVVAVCLITSLVLMGVYHSNHIQGDGYYTDPDNNFNSFALYLCAILLIVLMIATAFFVGRKDKSPFDTHAIALGGICVAFSFALSYVKLWDMPAGGSVTLVSFLPIVLFAFIYGSKKGLLIGFLYGMLQAIQDPWLIHPAQFLLDYPIAFSTICFAGVLTDLGVLKNLPQLKFALSAIITGVMRFFCHVLSGVFAFGAYAEGANFWLFSLAYNSYVFIDIALVIVVGIILLSSKPLVKQFEGIRSKETV